MRLFLNFDFSIGAITRLITPEIEEKSRKPLLKFSILHSKQTGNVQTFSLLTMYKSLGSVIHNTALMHSQHTP